MAASEGLLPSALPRIVASLDTADGEVGLRSFAASFLLLNGPVGVKMSICASSDCIVDSPDVLACDVPSPAVEMAPSCPSKEVPVLCGSVTLILGSASAMLVLTAQGSFMDVPWSLGLFLHAQRLLLQCAQCSETSIASFGCDYNAMQDTQGKLQALRRSRGILRK